MDNFKGLKSFHFEFEKNCTRQIARQYLLIQTHRFQYFVFFGSIQATKDKVSELQLAASSLEREVGSVRAELKKYKQRAEILERHRRVGMCGIK